MSSEPFVRVRGLGKSYSLYDKPWRKLADMTLGTSSGRQFWALRDVDLDLRPGDCVGVVGRNGAGKSTLLELICGLSLPTEGQVETRGRIAALLQLGVGFNPEFTGRENVYLAGTILGLSSAEITARFDAIADFADIGSFMDKPVREYSSGMYARLAFSTCAHADADVLVVDEILGVGDWRFQQKSMRLLRRFRRTGIILFVSHDEHSVASLCNKALWLERGRVMAEGSAKEVLYAYRREISRLMRPGDGFAASSEPLSRAPAFARQPTSSFDPDDPPAPSGEARVERVVLTCRGRNVCQVGGGEDLCLSVTFVVDDSRFGAQVLFVLRNPLGQVVFGGDSRDGTPEAAPDEPSRRLECSFRFQLPYLPTGNYPIDIFIVAGVEADGEVACLASDEAVVVLQVLSNHVSSGLANIRLQRAEILVGAEAISDG